MVKFNKLAVSSAAAVLAGMLILGGCGNTDSKETSAEASSEASAESTESTSEDDATAQMTADEEKISALDPKKPDDLGKVNKLEYKGLKFEAPKG